MVVVGFSI